MMITAPRLPDWRSRLSTYVRDCSMRPGKLGQHDCGIYPAGAVLAITGIDPIPGFRGRYTTQLGWVRLLKREGVGGLLEQYRASLEEHDDPEAARLGDVVLIDIKGQLHGGVRLQSSVSCVSETGLRNFGVDLIKHAFKVG